MSFVPLPLIFFFLLIAVGMTWWIAHIWGNNTFSFVPGWLCGICLLGSGAVFVFFASELCHYFILDPVFAHYVLITLIWVALAAISFMESRPQSGAIL